MLSFRNTLSNAITPYKQQSSHVGGGGGGGGGDNNTNKKITDWKSDLNFRVVGWYFSV